jgi:hypothetical protein
VNKVSLTFLILTSYVLSIRRYIYEIPRDTVHFPRWPESSSSTYFRFPLTFALSLIRYTLIYVWHFAVGSTLIVQVSKLQEIHATKRTEGDCFDGRGTRNSLLKRKEPKVRLVCLSACKQTDLQLADFRSIACLGFLVSTAIRRDQVNWDGLE